jgi:hypothetical protein
LFFPHAAIGFRKCLGVGDCEHHGLVKIGQEQVLPDTVNVPLGVDLPQEAMSTITVTKTIMPKILLGFFNVMLLYNASSRSS